MILKLFRHKKKGDSIKIFEGRVITDDEISEMIRPKKASFLKEEFENLNRMVDELKDKCSNGSE